MHLVPTPPRAQPTSNPKPAANVDSELRDQLVGAALVVVFAASEEIARIREAGCGVVALVPPYHVGEDDAYLLLPEDIGEEIVDILRDADAELLREALRDGLCVTGEITKSPRGRGMVLDADRVCSPLALLAADAGYAATVSAVGEDALRAINKLPHVQCTTLSALVDDDGLEAMLRAEEEFIGCAWRPPASAKQLSDIEPTYAWSRRLSEDRVGIELALFGEDEELVAVLRPACLVA